MKSKHFFGAALFAVCALGPASAFAQPAAGAKRFVPFNDFLANTRAASVVDFAGPDVKVKDEARFEEMRSHILSLYNGVQIRHSFVMNSSHFDCVPLNQQPGVKALANKQIAAAPPQSLLAKQNVADDGNADHLAPTSQFAGKQSDEYGNAVSCEGGTIPMLRVTLDDMTRFATLHDYFQKGPSVAGRPSFVNPKQAAPQDPTEGHKYSVMYQYVDNLGGNSNLNIWSPYVNTNWGEIFSLSQEWYVADNSGVTQTAEVGWQNFPQMYGNEESRLFVYWTADGYNQTGCYNLTCGAFIQTSNKAALGGGLGNYSTNGGTQYEFSAMFYLYQGNWWLAIQGNWIGYLPGGLYAGGQLSEYSNLIEYGTESVGADNVWPPEGSGNWSSAGFGHAALQRNVYYVNLSNQGIWTSLTPYDPSPSCYSTTGPFFSTASKWGEYFYEGGPGGPGC